MSKEDRSFITVMAVLFFPPMLLFTWAVQSAGRKIAHNRRQYRLSA